MRWRLQVLTGLAMLSFASGARGAPVSPVVPVPASRAVRAPAPAPPSAALRFKLPPRPTPAPTQRRPRAKDTPPVATSPETFAALYVRDADESMNSAAGASKLGNKLAAELRGLAANHRARPTIESASVDVYRPFAVLLLQKVRASTKPWQWGPDDFQWALFAPLARAFDELGSPQSASPMYEQIANNYHAPPLERGHAHARLGEIVLSQVHAWQKEASPFEKAVVHVADNRPVASRLSAAATHLRIAADLEPDPSRSNALLERAVRWDQDASAAPALPAADDMSKFSSRERRFLQALAELKSRGYRFDAERNWADGNHYFFQRPRQVGDAITVRYGAVQGDQLTASADEVLRHELQHFYDWAAGRDAPRWGPDDARKVVRIARSEARANYAVTRDAGEALALTGKLYPETQRVLDDLRAQVLAAQAASGRAGPVDRAVFVALMRHWRDSDLRLDAHAPPNGGPVKANAAPLFAAP